MREGHGMRINGKTAHNSLLSLQISAPKANYPLSRGDRKTGAARGEGGRRKEGGEGTLLSNVSVQPSLMLGHLDGQSATSYAGSSALLLAFTPTSGSEDSLAATRSEMKSSGRRAAVPLGALERERRTRWTAAVAREADKHVAGTQGSTWTKQEIRGGGVKTIGGAARRASTCYSGCHCLGYGLRCGILWSVVIPASVSLLYASPPSEAGGDQNVHAKAGGARTMSLSASTRPSGYDMEPVAADEGMEATRVSPRPPEKKVRTYGRGHARRQSSGKGMPVSGAGGRECHMRCSMQAQCASDCAGSRPGCE